MQQRNYVVSLTALGIENLKGIVVFDINGILLASSTNQELSESVPYAQIVESIVEKRTTGKFVNTKGRRAYASVTPIVREDNQTIGALAIFNDTAYIDVRLKEIWKDNIIRFFTLSILVA
jgi:sensor histidine kinase regulating citrate/malate metabolism